MQRYPTHDPNLSDERYAKQLTVEQLTVMGFVQLDTGALILQRPFT